MESDYLRLIAGQLHALLLMQTARDMFGKPWSALGNQEVIAVYNAVAQLESSQAQYLSAENVAKLVELPQEQKPQSRQLGFGVQEKKD